MILLSFSHKDKAYADELLLYLKAAKQSNIAIWTDFDIQPGESWQKNLNDTLSQASIIVLLVSPDYLASDFIVQKELPFLLSNSQREGVPVTWCLLRPCLYEVTEIINYQAIHDISRPFVSLPRFKRETLYSDVAQRIAQISDRKSTSHHEVANVELPHISATTGHDKIEITIARSFDEFSDEDQQKFLEEIADLLNVSDIRITNKQEGSVRLTLELTHEEAEELYLQAKEGKLSEHMVISTKLIGTPPPEKNQAFIIMKFGDEYLDSAYEGVFCPVLSDFGFQPLRIDEIQDSGKISEQVLNAIRKSTVILADLSGERPNCYYEAGFAHAIDKVLILTIRKGEKVHFDLADHRFIEWTTETNLRNKLQKRLTWLTGKKT